MFGFGKKANKTAVLKENTVHFKTSTGRTGQTDIISHAGVNTPADIKEAENHIFRSRGIKVKIVKVDKTRDFKGNLNVVNKNKNYDGSGY